MLSRIARLLFLLAVVLVGGAFSVVGAVPLAAHDFDPPFEMRFPQQAEKTSFSNDWRDHRAGGRRHAGNDLMASEKMVEVYAIADGVVAKVNERPRPGRYLIIEHRDGWDSLYIHLNDDNPGTDDGQAPWWFTLAPGVEEGAEVKAGQVIGWAGDSGNAEGNSPHTHFELHFEGHEVNPYQHLVEAYERDFASLFRTDQVLFNQLYESRSIG